MTTKEVVMTYIAAAVEWALSGELSWIQVAEILGLSARTVRRLRWRYEHHGYLLGAPPIQVSAEEGPLVGQLSR
jgi:transposase